MDLFEDLPAPCALFSRLLHVCLVIGALSWFGPVWEKVKKMYANVMFLQLLAPLKCMKLERDATNEN